MNKKIKRPYLFLIVSFLLLIETYKPVVNLIGFNFSETNDTSVFYGIGFFIGRLANVLFFVCLAAYFFNKFRKALARS